MQYGIVRTWDQAKGFGFIESDDDQDLFLHVSNLDITLEPKQLKQGMRVKFDVQSDMKGDKAIRIRRA